MSHKLNDETRSLLGSNDIEDVTLDWSDLENMEMTAGISRCESDGRLIGQCTSLKRLQFTGLRGYSAYTEERIGRFELALKGIANNRSIEELYLDGYGPVTCYSPTSAHEFVSTFSILSPFFENNHNFRRLRLGGNGLMFDKGTEQFAAAIGKCSSLKEFQLKCTSRDAEYEGVEILTALKNSKSNLTKLSLRECYSGWNECAELGELIQSKSSSLEELDLSMNTIDNKGAELLGRVLVECPTLKTLVLCSINVDLDGEEYMTPAGWKDLFKCLKSPTCALEELELQWGHTDETALALTEALGANTTLKTLKFWNNLGLSPRGWCSFFTNVLGNPNLALEHLDVHASYSMNEYFMEMADSSIATAIRNAIDGNTTLKSLDLTGFRSIDQVGSVITIASVKKMVFNKKSLGGVLSSNHSFSKLLLDASFPEDLVALLQLNQSENKERVVVEKIRRYYNTMPLRFSMAGGPRKPTTEDDELLVRQLRKDSGDLETKVMPFVLAWAGRGDWGNTLLFRLIRREPAVFASVHGNSSASGKRKMCE